MEIKKVSDQAFKKYGRIISGFDYSDIMSAMENSKKPDDGKLYIPSIKELEMCPSAKIFEDNIYGGMPIQIGHCNGSNYYLNAVEYHRDSEVNIACSDAILLLGKREDIKDDFTYDTSLMEAFLIEKGQAVELYSSTLHFAPCNANKDGFRMVIILPRGTNTDKPEINKLMPEDKLLKAKNKWLIAHKDSNIEGAFIGLVGENLCVK